MSLLNKASLIQIPSGYKDGTLYSAKPTNGDGDFTFSRGSNLAATRVNSEGLIEKGRENLLLQSNTFDTTWSNASTTETGGQTDKSGGTDAWKIDLTAGGGWIFQSISTSGVQTISVYAKAGTLDWVRLYASGSSTSFAYFDLVNGLVGITSGTIDTNIELISNGYYRIDMSFNHSSTTAVRIYPAQDDGDLTATSGNIYIQDAQLEQGLVATDYIETGASTAQAGILEDMPRLDYSGGTCPALLLEPQRTNLLPHSEYFGGWDLVSVGSASAPTITANYINSPEGLSNAYRVQMETNSGTSSDQSYIKDLVSLDGSSDYIFSFYIKSNTGVDQDLISLINSSFDATFSATSEWTRVEIPFTSNTTNARNFGLMARGNIQQSIDISIYGATIEQGSYPTSYIPTYGASVTRGADVALKTGIDSLIDDNEGTLYMEVTPTNFEGDQRFGVSDNVGSNRVVLRLFNPSSIQLSCVIGGLVEVSILGSGYSAGNTYKIAGAWENNNAVIYINGTQVATDTSCNTNASSPLNRISFDNGVGTAKWENPVSNALYFPTRLSNDELATLTTI